MGGKTRTVLKKLSPYFTTMDGPRSFGAAGDRQGCDPDMGDTEETRRFLECSIGTARRATRAPVTARGI